MREISYSKLLNEIEEILGKTKSIVVATCNKEKVTARTVNCVCDGINIYFITSKAYTKYKQLVKNHHIALAVNNIQIEGLAEILDHPMDNEYFTTLCEKDIDHDDYYKKYAHYKNSVLIKIKPCLITLYEGKGTYQYLNVREEKGYVKGKI